MGKLKEVVYSRTNNHCDLLADTVYKGVRYICVNWGFHPYCFVFCPEDFLERHVVGVDYIPGITVHGGVTYTGKINKLNGFESWKNEFCFGWDYGHVGDWEGYNNDETNLAYQNQKYTTDMLIQECESAIEQYLDIVKKDEDDLKKRIPEQKNVVLSDTPTPLTKDYLKELGFHPIYVGVHMDDESSMVLHGEVEKGKWKIFFSFTNPNQTYAFNQDPRKKYEGSIETVEDLKMVVSLCRIPLKLT